MTLSAGYLTVDTGEYHFHLHIGVPEGERASTSDPELARQRKISRAVFFSETREGVKGACREVGVFGCGMVSVSR